MRTRTGRMQLRLEAATENECVRGMLDDAYIRKAVVAGVVVGTWNGFRIIDEHGNRTEYFAQMVAKMNGTAIMLPQLTPNFIHTNVT